TSGFFSPQRTQRTQNRRICDFEFEISDLNDDLNGLNRALRQSLRTGSAVERLEPLALVSARLISSLVRLRASLQPLVSTDCHAQPDPKHSLTPRLRGESIRIREIRNTQFEIRNAGTPISNLSEANLQSRGSASVSAPHISRDIYPTKYQNVS